MLRTCIRMLLVAGLLGVAGCRQDEGRGAAGADPDTAAAAAVQPRSPAEIEQQAEPMTPQRAEELGVIDTTIQVTEEP
jgi:hypothetical protein